MYKYIDKPNIPSESVCLGLIDKRVDIKIKKAMEERGIRLVFSERCPDLYNAVVCHPDMLFHHLGGPHIIAAPNAPQGTINSLKAEGFNIIFGEKYITSKYPEDIAYNTARIGDYAVCSVKNTDKVLLNCLSDLGVKIIDVKQGYAKCSICIVDEHSIITSDEGLYKKLLKYDFDILKISNGFVDLPGLNYGFIGGASGLISSNRLYFMGDIRLHPDYENICNFLSKKNVSLEFLTTQKLIDLGTFIPLKEYSDRKKIS